MTAIFGAHGSTEVDRGKSQHIDFSFPWQLLQREYNEISVGCSAEERWREEEKWIAAADSAAARAEMEEAEQCMW